MGLSYDIISEFVKVTNGNKEKPKEGIVYATIVQASDGKYVKIDGSDLLTPTDTTTDIEDGERVTVMIKDHRATVTGNVTAPSASGNRVDKVVETVTEQIGVFETVVADKVSVNELEAYKATIENLVAGKAEIEDLEAINATIENLKVKDAEIENAVIDKADIEDLEAVNAVIENLKVKDAEIENLVADKATINDLNAVNADIQNLKVKHAQIEDLVADKADIEDLEAVNAVIEDLKVKDAEIENAVVDNLEATKAEIGILNADFAEIKTLVNGNLTSDNISSFNITAGKVTMEDAFIKDAMIDTVNAAKINAGRINTNSVVIGSEDGGMRISGATQQFTDKNGNVRIQIGRDASNDFTFALYGEDGRGQIINQNGITASAIADGLIVNDMVSDNAAISGGKLDISSVVTEINNDNTTTINSNKIYLDEQNQSLEVAFKSLKTQVDTIKDIDSDLTTITDKIQSNTSKIEANKSSISTLLAEDAAIKKQVTDLEGNVVETTNTLTSKYTSLQQNLDGFKTTVNNTYATKTSVNDVKNNLSSNYSTTSAMNSAIQQKVDAISASVSSTYATKNEVKTVDDNIKANYSTTEQMESAISVAKNEINLGISQVYETKTEASNKINNAVNSIMIGGTNLFKGYDANEIKLNDYQNTGSFTQFYNLTFNPADYIGKQFTISFYAKSPNGTTKLLLYNSNSSPRYFRFHTTLDTSLGADWRYYTYTFTNTDSGSNFNPSNKIEIYAPDKMGVRVKKIKVELGNKATDWTPAPEDIDTSINNAITTSKNYTDSQIKISKDTIELGVSQKYETKTSVSSQVSTALTSAKSYADTKKSEAISTASSDATTKANNALTSAKSYADTKKSEAITSANNTLNTTIANYYTKTQTDSQIKVAKDAINLGVSQTYETKTNVTSKVNSAISTASSDATTKANNALTSAKSYADTKKSEAINSANSTLNTTIANYYTKTQTDSAIKLAKDSVTTQVGKVEEIASSSLQGRMMYTDSTFATGYNSIMVYNNASGGNVAVTRITKSSDCPTTSGYMIQIKTIGTASPGHGGFCFATATRSNAILVTKIIAKIPSGYTLNFATNGIGTGGTHKWLTNNSGTGNWREYIYKVTCGNGGTLSSTNYFYISGGSTATSSAPVTWYLAMATVFDITATDNLEQRMNTAEQKITTDAIVSTVTSSTTYKNNLTGKVDKTTIISSINQTAESVKINASKIELTGSVVVNAINGGSTLINGSKIQTGTITANMITSGTFQGTNFIAGGSSNGNGYFQVKDSSNNVKFHASKNGVYATKIQFPDSISISGSIIQSGNISASSSGFTTSGSESGSLYRMEYNSNLGPLGLKISSQYYNTEGGANVAGTKRTINISGDAISFTAGSSYAQLSQSGTNIYSEGGYDSHNGYYCNGTMSLKKASHGGIDVGNTSNGVAICSKTSPTWWNGTTSYDIFNSGNCTITSGSGGTSYRFANGLQINAMQIWGTWNITTAWGSVYSSPYISPPNYTQTFLKPPQVSITAHGAGTAIMVCQAGAPTTTSPGSYYLWKPVQQTGVKDYIEIISIGRWK